jgi:amino acid adenylation domain-containing protein
MIETAHDVTHLPSPEWNRTDRAYPDVLLHEAFEQQVTRTPGAPAVRFRDQTLSYQELNERANQLAHHLIGAGAGPGTLVAVCMERSIEMVVALYGILKAGSAYVPIDPDYPADRIGFMLADARAPILLTQSWLADRAAVDQASVIQLDAARERLATSPTVNPNQRVGAEDLAYVIYTSGSTGKPKGAMIEHRSIVNRIYWMQDAYGLTSADRVLQKTPFSFDVSVWEFFWPLLFGAELVVADPGGHRDSSYLARAIVEHGITTIHFVPSMLQLFLEDPGAGSCVSLKRVICSGEALPKALQDRFFDRLGAELHNLYGPTEAAVDVTAWACDRSSELPFVPIGRPIANTQIHILDPDLQPVAVGVAGELYIGGVQVGRGYLNRPELSAERFIGDPFTDRVGARLYNTGDLARYLPDGNIEFLGRTDFQVKIRGFRVELGEIEAALESLPGIRQAVVTARERPDGDRELVAYVAHSFTDGLQVDQLRDRLGGVLPDYMVPARFIAMDQFPLTSSGKVDRKSLPAPDRQRPDLGTSFAAPRSDLERFIAESWQRILDLDQVGIHDRFFELGGTSLQGARFVNQMQDALGESIFVITLFSAPSIAEYAAFLETHYPDAVARLLGVEGSGMGGVRIPGAAAGQPLSEQDIERFRSVIPVRGAVEPEDGERNPPAIFILSPPRSGTTLLRVMLAGHPDLFAASELQLLGFSTLQERAAAYSGRFSSWLDGSVRTLMAAKGIDAEAAIGLMHAAESEGLTTRQFYQRLQAMVQPRMLVDKSPSYALDPGALRIAETEFDGARYIHLVRHPAAMIRSFERLHMEQILYLHDHQFSPRQLAELVWTLSHRTISDFLADVPEERWFRVRFEDLVRDPEGRMKALCAGIGIRFDPGLLRPYEGLNAKMIDGVHSESAPMGDPGFLAHGGIDASAAQIPVGSSDLGEPTRDLAARMGYELPGHVDRPGDPSRERPSRSDLLARQRDLRQALRGDHG